MKDWNDYVEKLGQNARRAARALADTQPQVKIDALHRIALSLRRNQAQLLQANKKDIAAAEQAGLAKPLVERLRLTDQRIAAMADGVEQIAAQPDPVGQIIEGYVRPNGLRIQKVRVPIGVVLFFYESRPNVTSDAAALCIKSGNAVILRGGKEALHSNRAIVQVIRNALLAGSEVPSQASEVRVQGSEMNSEPRTPNLSQNLDPSICDAVQFIDDPDRSLVPQLLKLDRHIDLVIPRGGESLIRAVVADSTIPVIKHYAGNCHVYIDAQCDPQMARTITLNAKTQRPSVCNAAETLLVHRDHAAAGGLLAQLIGDLHTGGVEVRGDQRAQASSPHVRPATDEDWRTEFLDLVLAVKVVDSLDEAIDHVNDYGSHHTDAIVTTSLAAAERFTRGVDSASVMVNASTRFADGGEYGLGAEIGISTDKLHARGPMGAMDLTTYKWIVTGDGHVRT
jgi:glutamate-5-semialdehyde dehydrogenase